MKKYREGNFSDLLENEESGLILSTYITKPSGESMKRYFDFLSKIKTQQLCVFIYRLSLRDKSRNRSLACKTKLNSVFSKLLLTNQGFFWGNQGRMKTITGRSGQLKSSEKSLSKRWLIILAMQGLIIQWVKAILKMRLKVYIGCSTTKR